MRTNDKITVVYSLSRNLYPYLRGAIRSLLDHNEDVKLIQLVRQYGDKSWTKISNAMGNRSDVQCRYHYIQLTKDMPHFLLFTSISIDKKHIFLISLPKQKYRRIARTGRR